VRPNDEPLADTLSRAAEQVGRREKTTVKVEVPPRVAIDPEAREALLRIMREAVTNAARHGQATLVHVTCSTGKGVRMRISDDGLGFDPDVLANGNGHYGVSGMRERVERLGGTFRLESTPGEGAALEVVLP
jgi:signal transduction histidine kinase